MGPPGPENPLFQRPPGQARAWTKGCPQPFNQHPHSTLTSEGSWLVLVAGIPHVAAPHELLDGRPI